MTISYPLSFPSHTGVRSITLHMRNAVSLSESPFTFATQVQENAGKRWEADISLPPMVEADARIWLAWLASLYGVKGTFMMADPGYSGPRGSAGGTPLVNGGGQTGSSLVIDGATPSQTGWLKAGDYVRTRANANIQLFMVMSDADSDGSGNVTLDVWPDIRKSLPDNSAVHTADPLGLWRLSSNVQTHTVADARIYGIQFSAVEAM